MMRNTLPPLASNDSLGCGRRSHRMSIFQPLPQPTNDSPQRGEKISDPSRNGCVVGTTLTSLRHIVVHLAVKRNNFPIELVKRLFHFVDSLQAGANLFIILLAAFSV